MIKPATLWGLMKSCDDSKWLGDICRALGGQDVELDFGQRQMCNSIRQDSDWLDEAMEIQREKWRSRQRDHRGRIVSGDKRDNGDMSRMSQRDPPSILPSILPSIQLSKESECDNTHARSDVPSRSLVVSTATSNMGIAKEYAEWWYDQMDARGWTKVNGSAIDNVNWRPVLMSWWNRAKESGEATRVQNERKLTATASERVFRDVDWVLCEERCAAFKAGSCTCGMRVPPEHRAPPQIPEQCSRFVGMED